MVNGGSTLHNKKFIAQNASIGFFRGIVALLFYFNVLPEIDDVVDWLEDWVVDIVDNVADEEDGNVDGFGDKVSVGFG